MFPYAMPGTGTPVPNGITAREAFLAVEMLAASGKLISMDLVEVNPILDERNRTGRLASELIQSALGKTVYQPFVTCLTAKMQRSTNGDSGALIQTEITIIMEMTTGTGAFEALVPLILVRQRTQTVRQTYYITITRLSEIASYGGFCAQNGNALKRNLKIQKQYIDTF